MIQDNEKGFTLVELVISIAIFSLVSSAIIYFMIAGGNSYAYTKGEVNLQTESQVIMAQLNDMLREANYVTYDSAHHALSIYQVEETVTNPVSMAVSKSVKDKKVVYWDSQTKSLYFQEFSSDANPDYANRSVSMTEERLFSEYMEGFQVAVEDSAVTVKLDMKTNNDKNHYKVDNTMSIRNRMITYP